MSQTTNSSVWQRYNRLMGRPEDYKHGNNARQSLVDLAQTVDPDGITDLGDMEPLDVGQSLPSGMASGGNAPTGVSLPVPTVLDTLAKYKSPLDTAVDHAMETLPHTLHALRNSLNNEPDKLKSLARQSGLSIGAVESDPAFAQKKIQSDLYARALGDVAKNWRLSPNTAAFLREADALEQLSLTSDTALWALERDLRNREHGFFDSGYIGAALNAWDIGLVSREVGQLGYKWMLGSITEEERQRLDILRRAEAHYHGQKEEMALLERMVRGTVEALGVPLAGGIAGAFEFLGRYGKEGLTAGAVAGAAGGSAAGGVGAVPGAIAGGITGLSAVAQAGFANDMMRQEGGLTFLSLVDMGVPEDTARVLAFAAGGLKGALEYVGLREVGRIFPGAEKFLTSSAAAQAIKTLEKTPSIAAMLGDTAIAMLRGLAGETGTEVAQEVVDIAAEETGRQLSNVNRAAPTAGEIGERLLEVAKETLISTALVAGAGGAVRGAWHYRNAKKRESLLQGLRDADAGIMDTVANAVQQSPVMRDMPETGAALLQHLADNGVTPDTVYIRPEAVQQIFFQAEDPELMAIAAEMGITPESLQDNLTLGTDVAVDFAKATEHIMADSARYEALRGDMRTSPLLPTDAEMAQLENMAEDAEARLAYLDNLLAPLAAEAEEAQTRHDQRMEIAAPYVQQLLGAGYSQNQAEAYGLVLAANAERMASLFGMSPQDYLAERFAGYVPMQQAEFEELAYDGLDGLIENRETAALLQELGITPGMSAAARRRRLQPEFAYVWGKVNPESVQNQYGMEQYRELRRMFGPGFFARKGEGLGIDVLATQFYDEERGMYDMNRSDLDTDTFIERVFMPHDEFERGVAGQLRQNMLWQRDAEGNAIAPGETAPRVAAVVDIDPARIVDGQGRPVDLKRTADVRRWLRQRFQGGTVEIADDGTIQKFTGGNLNASAKRRGKEQRQAYAGLDTLLHNALFDHFEEADKRHKGRVAGQNVYYSAARIGDRYFSVRFKVDMPAQGEAAYKDHKVTEIEIAPSLYPAQSQTGGSRQEEGATLGIAPSLYAGQSQTGGFRQNEGAIRGVSLSVLKGDVKPSRIEGNILYQFIGEQGAGRLDAAEEATTRLDNLAVAREMEQAGKDAKAVKLATGWERGADGKWRYEVDDSGVKVSLLGDMVARRTDANYARYMELFDRLDTLTEQEKRELFELDDQYGYTGSRERWRQEVADGKEVRLAEMMDAPELFAAYPDLRKVKVSLAILPGSNNRISGRWDGEEIVLDRGIIYSGKAEENNLRAILLHEVQHAIQDIEGFAGGGNPNFAFAGRTKDAALAELQRLREVLAQPISREEYAQSAGWEEADMGTEEFEEAYAEYVATVAKSVKDPQLDVELQKTAGLNVYKKLAGEVEARNTSARSGMTAAERLQSLASETEDVAREDQIILRDGLQGAAMAEGATNSYGVPLERVTVIDGDITPADVEAALKELAGRDLPNLIEGITAQVNSNQRRKLNSATAAGKSIANDFTRSEHRGIASKIAQAWQWAAEAQRGAGTKGDQADMTIRRFVSALNVNGREAYAWITVKDGQEGSRIYSVELVQKEKLRDMVGGVGGKTAPFALNRSFEEIISRLRAPVNPRGNTLYQREQDAAMMGASPAIQVDGSRLGVPEGASVHEYAAAAKKYHDALKHESENGKPVVNKATGKEIRFSLKGWKKNKSSGADVRKWKLFPYLREILENARHIRSEETTGRTDEFTHAHWFETDVVVDGEQLRAGVTLLEDVNGNLFYNIRPEVGHEQAPHTLKPDSKARGIEGPEQLTGELSPGEPNIAISPAPVNPRGGGFYQREQTRNARGAMTTLPDGRAVVGLFKSANASTVLHETAHFWLEELRRAAQLDTAPDWVREAWGKLQKAYGFEGHLLDDTAEWSRVQERFARDFEAYTREGKAPSWELQTAFNRFRNWLVDIYRSVKSLLGGNELGEDVRQVFDALLATEEEIEQSRRAVEGGSVMDLLPEGEVSPELRDRYARAAQKAYENASAAIANRKLVDRRAAEKRIREEATAAIDGSETYQLLARLRVEGGIAFADLLQHANEDVAYELRRKWGVARGEGKALIKKGGTLDILDVAAQFDQDSGQGLVGVLLETPTRREAIDAEVERRLAEWDAQYDAEVEYSAAYDAALAVELEALTGQRQISPAQLRRQMEAITGVKKMDAVDAEYKALKARLQADEQTARRAWNAATREANANARQKLAELKEQERLRRAALGAAYRARMERDDIVRQLRRIGASKSVPYEYMLQIRRLLGNWKGLGSEGQRLDPATLRKMPSLQEFLAEKSTETGFDEQVSVPEWMLNDMQAQRFGDLSLEQMRDVKRMVTMLAHMGRAEGKMLAAEEQREIKAVAAECAESANKLSARVYVSDRAGVLDTVRGALRKALSSLTSVRFLARALDGFNKQGANHDAWLMPLQQARSNELLMEREMEAKLREALAPLLRVGKLHTAFAIDGVPLMPDVSRQWAGMWDMEKVYCVALNMGNAGNLKALLRGYGWSEENINAITASMTAEEWQAVQAVWDAIDTLYPRLNEVYKKLKGVPLPKVEAQPFTVQTADGQTLRLKGGYYPLIFDQRLSDKAAENQSVDEMLNGMEAILRSPNPQSGMTKERKGGTLPPRLSLNVLDRHVRDTVHYITHALPLRDTVRLFREPVFKEAFIRAAGQENYDQLLPWLRGIARPGGEQATGAVAAIDWLARRGSLYALGANMKSALLQLTSMGNSWSEVGFTAFWRGAATLLSSPQQSWQMVREKSAYMQSRSRLLDDTLRREYEDMRARGVQGLRFGGISYALDTVRQAQMALMISLDAAVAYPTWLAAYDNAIARGLEEGRAVAEADSAVIAAQSGGGPLDTPAVMRQAGLMRALCPFMSFALGDFNRKLETVRGLAEWSKTGNSAINPAAAFRDFAFQWVLPVGLTVLMVSLGRDGEPPEGEDFVWEALTFYTMGIPVLRDVTKMAESQFGPEGFKGGRTPLMFAGLDNAVRGMGHTWKAWEEDDPDAGYRAMKEILNAAGFALGLGTPQSWRTIEGSEAYWVDGEGGPLAPLLGKPRK